MSERKTGKPEYTLGKIAQELGLNKATVSRAISGKGRVNPQTRERVLAFIEAHEFRPNAVARSLANSRTYNIGVLIPQDAGLFESSFFNQCFNGICSASMKRDYDVLTIADGGGDLAQLRRVLYNHKAEGIILIRSTTNAPEKQLLLDHDIPYVVIGPADHGSLSVDNDNEAACRALTEKVLRRGNCRKPALLGGDTRHRVTRSRYLGYMAGCADAGIEPEQELIRLDLESVGIDGVTDQILKAGADVVFCMDELICSVLMMRLKDRSVQIPQALQIACFYDSPILELMSPTVTAIRFDASELGFHACDQLINAIDGKPASSTVIPDFKIIERESTLHTGA